MKIATQFLIVAVEWEDDKLREDGATILTRFRELLQINLSGLGGPGL